MPKKMNLKNLKMIDERTRQDNVKRSVKETTQKTYGSTLKSFCDMVAALRGVPAKDVSPLSATKMEFLSVCDALMKADMGTANMILAALKKESAKMSVPITWIRDEDVVATATAVQKSAARSRLPCGVLTEEHFSQLLDHLRDKKEDEMRQAVLIATLGRLRIGELQSLQTTDFLPAGDVAFVFLRENKSGDEEVNKEPKLIPLALLQEIKASSRAAAPHLFAKGVDKRLRDGMKVWSRELGWSSALRFSGPHVFRHTGSSILRERLCERIGTEVLRIFAQQSVGVLAHYSLTAEERLAKKRRTEH